VPKERNGPNGISDLIVRLFVNRGKFIWGLIFFIKIAKTEKVAPIQKAKTMADRPCTNPNKKPSTIIYLTSPNPNQAPLEKKKIRKKGKAKTRPERKN